MSVSETRPQSVQTHDKVAWKVGTQTVKHLKITVNHRKMLIKAQRNTKFTKESDVWVPAHLTYRPSIPVGETPSA